MKRACRTVSPLLGVFADGELSPEKVVELEQHLAGCRSCTERVRFEAALRSSVRRAVRGNVPSAAFQDRVRAALAAERQRVEAQPAAPREHRMLPWRAIVPLASAAALSLVWAGNNKGTSDVAQSDGAAMRPSFAATTADNVDDLIEQFVRHHAEPPAPRVTEPALLRQLEPEVGIPVHFPNLHQYGARWEGGSVMAMPVANQRAASLRYRLAGHPVTLYVYDSKRFPLRATLEPRVVRDQPVYVGSRRGYTVAAVETRGVGYAIATDLNDRESAELVVATTQ